MYLTYSSILSAWYFLCSWWEMVYSLYGQEHWGLYRRRNLVAEPGSMVMLGNSFTCVQLWHKTVMLAWLHILLQHLSFFCCINFIKFISLYVFIIFLCSLYHWYLLEAVCLFADGSESRYMMFVLIFFTSYYDKNCWWMCIFFSPECCPK